MKIRLWHKCTYYKCCRNEKKNNLRMDKFLLDVLIPVHILGSSWKHSLALSPLIFQAHNWTQSEHFLQSLKVRIQIRKKKVLWVWMTIFLKNEQLIKLIHYENFKLNSWFSVVLNSPSPLKYNWLVDLLFYFLINIDSNLTWPKISEQNRIS